MEVLSFLSSSSSLDRQIRSSNKNYKTYYKLNLHVSCVGYGNLHKTILCRLDKSTERFFVVFSYTTAYFVVCGSCPNSLYIYKMNLSVDISQF